MPHSKIESAMFSLFVLQEFDSAKNQFKVELLIIKYY